MNNKFILFLLILLGMYFTFMGFAVNKSVNKEIALENARCSTVKQHGFF